MAFKTLTTLTLLTSSTYGAKEMAVATFSASNTGVSGYVKVTNGNLMISLNTSLVDNDTISSTCLSGMAFHIHEFYPVNETNDLVGSTACGRPETGNHWDPWLACGGATDNDYCASDLESSLPDGGCVGGSTVLGGESYSCSPDTFLTNPYACEVGDWNGKYGRITPDSSGIVDVSYSSPYEVDPMDLVGLSVVFHCGLAGAPRAFCAPFIFSDGETDARPTQSGNSDATAMFSALSSTSSVVLSNTGDYTINIDPTSLTIPNGCGDLLLRIYSDWTYEGYSTTSMCSNYVGYFFDPTVTCAYGSMNSACTGQLLCNYTSYTYMCDPTKFSMPYDRFECAPGDLSGKYGTLSSTMATTNMTGNDPLLIDLSQLDGKSVVLQCSSTWEMVACAGFNYEAPVGTTMEPTDDDSAFSTSVQFGTIIVMIASFGLTFF